MKNTVSTTGSTQRHQWRNLSANQILNQPHRRRPTDVGWFQRLVPTTKKILAAIAGFIFMLICAGLLVAAMGWPHFGK